MAKNDSIVDKGISVQNEDKTVLIMTEGKYGLLLSGKNWIVGENKTPTSQNTPDYKDFDNNSYSYHANIQQAIINMADRMTKDNIKKSCKDKPLKLQELVEIIREKDQWMRKAIKGRCQ